MATIIRIGDTEIEYSLGGHLGCGECKTVWCQHIERALRKNWDQEQVWEFPDSILRLMIPYIPTEHIWASVDVQERSENGSRAVMLLNPVDSTDVTILGNIFPGEGRIVIRDLLHNWFQLQLYHPATGKPLAFACNQGTHKYQQEITYARNMDSETSRWTELWTIYWWGACLSCKAILDTVADLVPEKA